MTALAKKVQKAALDLSRQDRAALAEALLRSLDDGEDDEDAELAWDAELARRLADVEAGRVEGRPAEAVLKELEDRLR